MNEIVNWCNDNQGFISATLSIITVIISFCALFLSIKSKRPKINVQVNPSSTYIWLTDFLHEEISDAFYKWVRITNVSANPISIYECRFYEKKKKVSIFHIALLDHWKLIKSIRIVRSFLL